MKSVKNLTVIAIIILAIAACKKDKTESPSVVGSWTGKYSNDVNEYPTRGIIILFRNNGTLKIYDGLDSSTADHADGTYTITGSDLSVQYAVSASYNYWFTADVNDRFTFMEGAWGISSTTTPGGKMFLSKE